MEAVISAERVAQNQSLYRSINEKIEELNSALTDSAQEHCEWICECADTECTLRIVASLREYETVRSNPRRFIVKPGHVHSDVERVVEENDRFMVVEKLGEAARHAEELDPRQLAG